MARILAQCLAVAFLAILGLGTGAPAAENAGIGPEDVSSGQVSPPSYSTGRESRKVAPPSGGAAQAESAARAGSPAVKQEIEGEVYDLTPPVPGPQGEQGPPGRDGATGPAGPQGQAGKAGKTVVITEYLRVFGKSRPSRAADTTAAQLRALQELVRLQAVKVDRLGRIDWQGLDDRLEAVEKEATGHGRLQREMKGWGLVSRSFVEARDTKLGRRIDAVEKSDKEQNAALASLNRRVDHCPTWLGLFLVLLGLGILAGLVWTVGRLLRRRRPGVILGGCDDGLVDVIATGTGRSIRPRPSYGVVV